MGSILSKYKQKRLRNNVTSQILQLKSQRGMLKHILVNYTFPDELTNYQTVLYKNTAQIDDEAVKLAKRNQREMAVLLLRKKGLLKEQITVITEYIFSILKTISDIEMAQVQADLIHHLEIGSKLISTITGKVKAANIEKIMETQAENIQELEEIAALCNLDYSNVNDAILLQELDEIIKNPVPVGQTSPISTKLQIVPEPKYKEERQAVLA
ncbi:Snf7 family [Babesia duncani]|uniref:Snf7 family n=1 Tax=Babesia duncani TaxID=323732 RepID=A0AAD9UNK2_9APIC|nr:Snf7 family [Babesia duncani]